MENRDDVKAVVLAAGVGSRLDPLTSQIPKPLVPVANIPVMEHLIRLLAKHNIKEVHANLHYMPEKITKYFGDGSDWDVDLNFMHEPKLSGDAGGVRACKQYLKDGTFVVLMGDLLTDADLTKIIAEHKAKGALASIALKQVPKEELNRFGVVVTNDEGYITGFQEKPEAEEALSDKISTGIYVFEPEIFNYMPEHGELGFGRQVFPKLIELGLPLLGIEIDDYWSDVGTIQQYREANFDAVRGLMKVDCASNRSVLHQNGVVTYAEGVVIDPGCSIKGSVVLGRNSRIGHGTIISGHVVIGENCVIEPGAFIKDSVIWANNHVQSDAYIENSVICSDSVCDPNPKHINVNRTSELAVQAA